MEPSTEAVSESRSEAIALYRPIGLNELAQIWDLGFQGFPARARNQHYLYPLTSFENARQLARDWNARDEASVFSGFVVRFEVADEYLRRFSPQSMGSSDYLKYCIPATDLNVFNQSLQGRIAVEAAFFGDEFDGYIPANFALKGKSAVEQFVSLARMWEYNSVDFNAEVAANRKAIYLNSWFWAQHDFSSVGIGPDQKRLIFERLKNAWEINRIDLPWPGEELERAIALCGPPQVDVLKRYSNARSAAGGRVDRVESEEALDVQHQFRQKVKVESTRRPATVTFAASVLFLSAVYCLSLIGIAIFYPEMMRTGDPSVDADTASMFPMILPLRIVAAIVLGAGLWQVKRWARKTVLFYAFLSVAWTGVGAILTSGRMRFGIGSAIAVAIDLVLIGCLVSRKASLAFESRTEERG